VPIRQHNVMLYTAGGLIAASVVTVLHQVAGDPQIGIVVPAAHAAVPLPGAGPAPAAAASAAITDLLLQDPLAVARMGRERYERDVRDYTCTLLKQERIAGKLRETEEIYVLYRESPHSVYMIWKKNADQAKRALFIDRPDFVDAQGRKLAVVEPAGAIIRLFVSEVKLPIHGPQAERASRRTIDEFGFRSLFGLLNRYNEIASQRGELDFRYTGEGEIDGRPTYVFVRLLPLGRGYPDARLVVHLDQEWLLPTSVSSYADTEGKQLLGSYVYTRVQLNPGLSEADFRF